MIAVEHRLASGERMTGAVGEGVVTPLKLKRIERALMRDAAQRQNGAQVGQRRDTRLQKLAALSDLARSGLVRWRHAAHRVGDHAVDERESLRPGEIVMTAGKAYLEQRLVKQLAGIIAEKRSPGAVRPLQAWRQSHDQQSRRLWSKRGDGTVEPARMSGLVRCTKGNETRADRTFKGRFGFTEMRLVQDRHRHPIGARGAGLLRRHPGRRAWPRQPNQDHRRPARSESGSGWR